MKEETLREIWNKTSGHCHFCGDPVDFEKRGWREGDLNGYWEIDHVIQHRKGGVNSPANYLPACTRCNRLRWHRTGEQVRDLIFLGLIAKDEIRKSSETGKKLIDLHSKRLNENKKRRLKRKENHG
jgi:5-methylcytosine-specific restriction endonuclease McrA